MSSLTEGLSGGIKKLPASTYLIGGTILIAVVLIGGSFIYSKRPAKQETNLKAGLPNVLPSSWLVKYFGHDDEYDVSVSGPTGDPDLDLLTNFQEFYFNTDPTNPDTDGDGKYDGQEIVLNSNPSGEGQLYSDFYTKTFAEEYIERNNIQEFKEENVQEFVYAILNPPESGAIDIQLPPVGSLKIAADTSEEAVLSYVNQVDPASQVLKTAVQGIEQALATGDAEVKTTAGQFYKTAEDLRNITAPSGLLSLHQLQIAALFSSGQALEIANNIDPLIPFENQQDLAQSLFTEITRTQKLVQALSLESLRLAVVYPESFSQ